MRSPLLALCLVGAACAKSATPPAQTVTELLDQLSAAGSINASVLVARGGSVLVSKGYGYADGSLGTPNTPQTRFRIGSNTKQFTAAAILMLADQGKLSLHDPICSYLDACPAAWQPLTIHQLLTHSSGIPNYTDFDNFPGLIGTAVSVQALIDRFKPSPLAFAPGAEWLYSNSGYVVLGAIVEKVSGVAYAGFLAQNIFAPLGMKDTGYDSNDPPVSTHATGYLSPGVKPVFLDMSEFYSAGALYSTVEDLYAWDTALLSGKVLSPASYQAMISPQVPCPTSGCAMGGDLGYGYGWFIARESSRTYVYHWGRIDGFVSSNGFYPKDDVIVVVLSNLETTDAFGIGTRLGELALPH